MNDAHYTVQAAARRTGLSPHVIRIWEKRYGAVEPVRTETNRRVYSESEIERLTLLRELTQSGHSIGQVAKLSLPKLRSLCKQGNGHAHPLANGPTPDFLAECLSAVRTLDSRRLEQTLERAVITLGAQGLLQRVVAPLAQSIGDLWRDGVITPAHEHFASAVIRVFLGHATKAFAAAENAPVIVVGTPLGQLHELGALLAGAAAANLGWHVTYLGPSLPAGDIAGAAILNRARTVALSVVYPEDDPRMEQELRKLREFLPPDTSLLVGGRALPAYRSVVGKIGGIAVDDLSHLCSVLEQLRRNKKEES